MNVKRGLGFAFIGLAFVVTIYNVSITGAVIGTSLSDFIGVLALVFFVVGAFMIFKGGRENLEERIENKVVGSKVKNNPFILRVAQEIGRKQDISRDVNHLTSELNKGNTNPGVGTKNVFQNVYELRGRNGGRVYYWEKDKDKYEVLAYSDKGNQQKVINRLRDLYSENNN